MTRVWKSLLHHLRRLASAGRVWLARRTGAEIGEQCRVGAGADLLLGVSRARSGTLKIGDAAEIGAQVVLHPYGGSIEVGRRVHLGPATVVYGHGGVTIGDGTLVAMHCALVAANHTIPTVDEGIRDCPDAAAPIAIGRDCWLGAGVTVLAGVTIGDGCVVGAGAVVTRDLPPFSIALGVPARITGHRPSS